VGVRRLRGDIGFEVMDGKVPDRPDLSPQKNKVLRLMADGASTRDLAKEVKISERTAGGLITETYKKLSRPPDTDEPPVTHE
jgi:DNA-binding NarL/FixJ family response regulator